MAAITHLFKSAPDEGRVWCAEVHPMGTTHPLSTTCLRCLAIGLQHFERIAAMFKPPHDSGSAPPKGFTRYCVELDCPDDIDPSDLLERAQDLAAELIEAVDSGEHAAIEALGERIANRVSVQVMEG